MQTELGKTCQNWHPVVHTARDGLSVERVGELDLKYKVEELIILTSGDYAEIRKVPHLKLRDLLRFSLILIIELPWSSQRQCKTSMLSQTDSYISFSQKM